MRASRVHREEGAEHVETCLLGSTRDSVLSSIKVSPVAAITDEPDAACRFEIEGRGSVIDEGVRHRTPALFTPSTERPGLVTRTRTIGLITALVLLALPAVAQAGCTAAGSGNPTYVDGSMRIIGGIQCTTNNGSLYQARTYMQGNAGGWHIVSGPLSKNYSNPPNNYFSVSPYYFPCSPLTPQDSQVRSKIVVENMVTHTTDIGYSGAVTRPSNCQ